MGFCIAREGGNEIIMKYSIIMPYYDRAEQLKNTLQSFIRLYSDRMDFQIVLVVDNKMSTRMTQQYYAVTAAYEGQLQICTIWSSGKNLYNPAIAFNEGAEWASGSILILTSPECKHETNILAEMDVEFKENIDAYVVCACKSIRADGTLHMWYQHTEHRNERYHFCSAITKKNYKLIEGFDERYAYGYGYDDDDFRDRVMHADLQFCVRDDLLVAHQHHEKVRPPDYKEKLVRNKRLYESGKVSRNLPKLGDI